MLSRKFFAKNVALPAPGGVAVASISALLKAAGWGFELNSDNDITTTPSLDSFLADALTIVPAVDLYVGHDAFVRDAASASTPGVTPRYYKGTLAQAGLPFSVTDWLGHVVDTDASWVYSKAGATTLDLIADFI